MIISIFNQDLITIAKPSISTQIAINLDETVLNKELLDYIVNSLNSVNKVL